ncbi:unnamed protein product, partial [Timema podura]|nr:unnamed protein product [Timema podura]
FGGPAVALAWRDGGRVKTSIGKNIPQYIRPGFEHRSSIHRHSSHLRESRLIPGVFNIEGEFIFSDTVKTIPIAPKSKVPNKGEVTLAGWGRIKFYNSLNRRAYDNKTNNRLARNLEEDLMTEMKFVGKGPQRNPRKRWEEQITSSVQ